MKGKVDNVIKIPTTFNGIFKLWFEFLKPLHKMSPKEIDVASALLRKRYELSKSVLDDGILDKLSLSTDVRKEIMKEQGLPSGHFNVVISNLKKNKFIIDDRINPRFIPRIIEDKGNFQLLFLFDFSK